MTDEEFLKAFEDCTLKEFHHVDHIRMAWIYLRKFGYETGSIKVKEGIKKFAVAKNATMLYNETITQFWIRLVHRLILKRRLNSFEDFFASFGSLCEAKSIFRHYTKELLMSQEARSAYQEPDLLSMPL